MPIIDAGFVEPGTHEAHFNKNGAISVMSNKNQLMGVMLDELKFLSPEDREEWIKLAHPNVPGIDTGTETPIEEKDLNTLIDEITTKLAERDDGASMIMAAYNHWLEYTPTTPDRSCETCRFESQHDGKPSKICKSNNFKLWAPKPVYPILISTEETHTGDEDNLFYLRGAPTIKSKIDYDGDERFSCVLVYSRPPPLFFHFLFPSIFIWGQPHE